MKYIVLLLIVVNVVCLPHAIAQQPLLESDYKSLLAQGHDFYRQKNFQSALNVYQQSYVLAPLDSTLNNIAICHFKLKQWPQALVKFEELNGNQQGVSLIEYYIAVTHKKLGNAELASKQFYELLQNSDDDAVAIMAAKQLKLLSSISEKLATPTATKPQSIWQSLIDVQVGYDSNVSLPFDDEQQISRGEGDQYMNFLANTSWLSNLDYKNAWLIDLTLFNSTYHEASDYDIRLLSMNGRKFFTPEKWENTKVYIGLTYDDINLAGNDYLNNTTISLGTSYQLSKQQRVIIELSYKNVIEGSIDYAYLAGTSNRLKLTWRQKTGNGYWKAGLITERDDRADKYSYMTTTEGALTDELDSFTSYSTNRLSLFATKFWQIDNWEFNASAKYRHSNYDAENIQDNESVGYREDKLFTTIFGSAYNITEDIALSAEIDWSNNDSSLAIYEYSQYTLSIGTTWIF